MLSARERVREGEEKRGEEWRREERTGGEGCLAVMGSAYFCERCRFKKLQNLIWKANLTAPWSGKPLHEFFSESIQLLTHASHIWCTFISLYSRRQEKNKHTNWYRKHQDIPYSVFHSFAYWCQSGWLGGPVWERRETNKRRRGEKEKELRWIERGWGRECPLER